MKPNQTTNQPIQVYLITIISRISLWVEIILLQAENILSFEC